MKSSPDSESLRSAIVMTFEKWSASCVEVQGPVVAGVWEEMLVSMLEQHEEILSRELGTGLRAKIREFLRERATLGDREPRLFAWSWFVRLEYASSRFEKSNGDIDHWTEEDWANYDAGRVTSENVYRITDRVRIRNPFFLLIEEGLNIMTWVTPPIEGLPLSVLRELPLIDVYLVDPSMQWCVAKTHEPDCGPYLLRNYSRCSFL